jgi:hypothetical protein
MVVAEEQLFSGTEAGDVVAVAKASPASSVIIVFHRMCPSFPE